MPAPPDPVAFVIPFLERPVYWYGLMVTLGTLAGAFVADREARRRDLNPDHVWNALMFVMVFGLFGARLYHVVSAPADSGTNLQHYLQNPVEIIAFWDGGLRGLGIFGAIVGGLVGLWMYVVWVNRRIGVRLGLAWLRLRLALRLARPERLTQALAAAPEERLSLPEWIDISVVGVPLGQAIGRWGNYFNQELYGNPTKLPWGVPVDAQYRLPRFQAEPETTRFHPTFLYESLWNLLVFFVLSYIAHHWSEKLRDGDLALIYLILYPLGRYFAEIERPDAWVFAGIPVAQLVSVGVMFLAALVLLLRHGLGPSRRGRLTEG